MVSQTAFLLRTQLALKSWNVVLFLPILLALLFSSQLSTWSVNNWIESVTGSELIRITGIQIQDSRPYIVYDDELPDEQLQASLKILTSMDSGLVEGDLHGRCTNKDAPCFSSFYTELIRNNFYRQKYVIDYQHESILCPAGRNQSLYCSFFGTIYGHALSNDTNNQIVNWFKNYSVFRLTSTESQIETASARSVCSFNNFIVNLPRTTALTFIVFQFVYCFYFLITTLSCISQLKSGGLLQLMIRRGLSVFSYWMSIWIWVSAEILLLSVSLTLSFYMHCGDFYTLRRIYLTFLNALVHLYSVASFLLLLTVLTKNYYAMSKCIAIFIIVVWALIAANWLVYEASDFRGKAQLRKALLLLPCGNVAELLQANLAGQTDAGLENDFHTGGACVNITFTVVVIAMTMYLDFVLRTGNGLRYPNSFLCATSPTVTNDLPKMQIKKPSVEEYTDKLSVLVRLVQVSAVPTPTKMYATSEPICDDDMSVDLYDRHFTVVISDDEQNVTEFLGILTGRVPMADGQLWINGFSIADWLSRPLSALRLTECPAENALCDDLTVLETIEMALASSGVEWSTSELEIHSTLSLLRLVDLLQHPVFSLSVSQRRNLAIACALLGKPKLVVLCDPTRHLDPASCQRLWRLIAEHRRERSIVVGLPTHCFSEINDIDMRADRIIVLASKCRNSILCAGSSAFIRNAVNCGLTMQVRLRDGASGSDALDKLRASLSPSMASSDRFYLDNNLLVVCFDNSFVNDPSPTFFAAIAKALKAIEHDTVSVGVKRLSLFETIDCIKNLSSESVDKLFLDRQQSRNLPEQASIKATDDLPRNVTFKRMQTAPKSYKRSFPRATCGLFWFGCLLLRRTRCRFIGVIAVHIFLLGIYIALVVLEKDRQLNTHVIYNLFKTSAQKFSRGICISNSDVAPAHMIDQHRCTLFFTKSVIPESNYISIQKTSVMGLYDFLRQPDVLARIHRHCSPTADVELPCPIVYANSWGQDVINKDRQLVVGSYSTILNNGPHLTASTAFITSLMATQYFLPVSKTSYRTRVHLLSDYQEARLPLFGVEFQIFILSLLPIFYAIDIVQQKAMKWPDSLVGLGISKRSYWASTLLIHWLQYAAVYLIMATMSILINPVVYMTRYQLLVMSMTGIFGLVNNLLLAYLLIILFPCFRHLLILLYLAASLIMSILPEVIASKFYVSIVLMALLPPYATGMLAFYSTRVYYYLLQVDIFLRQCAKSQFVPDIFEEPLIEMILIIIPTHFVVLSALLALLCRCCCSKCHCGKKEINESDQEEAIVPGESEGRLNGSNAVELRSLTKQCDPKVYAAQDVSMDVKFNDVCCVVGSASAGVTTVLSAIAGRLKPPLAGSCRDCRRNCRRSPFASKIQIGGKVKRLCTSTIYSHQVTPLFKPVTIREHMCKYAKIFGASDERTIHLMQQFHFQGDWDRPVGRISVGEKRRLGLAIALLSNADLYVLDDVSSGFCPYTRANLWKTIYKNTPSTCTIVASARSMIGVEQFSTRFALMNHGQMISCSPLSQLHERYGIYILEIRFKIPIDPANKVSKKVDMLREVLLQFFGTEVLDQTMSLMKIALPIESVNPIVDSLQWLAQFQLRHDITDLQFYPAKHDQMLEFILSKHDRQAQRQASAPLTGPPLVDLPEFYDV